jgi:hypothetical protein
MAASDATLPGPRLPELISDIKAATAGDAEALARATLQRATEEMCRVKELVVLAEADAANARARTILAAPPQVNPLDLLVPTAQSRRRAAMELEAQALRRREADVAEAEEGAELARLIAAAKAEGATQLTYPRKWITPGNCHRLETVGLCKVEMRAQRKYHASSPTRASSTVISWG